MLLPPEKEIVLEGTSDAEEANYEEARKMGIKRLLIRGDLPDPRVREGFFILKVSDDPGIDKVSWVKIETPSGVTEATAASQKDQAFVVVECNDWKIIPLENLIADFKRRGKKLYAFADSREEIQTALAVLERGVDGVVIPPQALREANDVEFVQNQSLEIVPARIERVVEAGQGDRACVDTTSQLSPGEGLLIGSQGSFFFLVHGETIDSEYIPSRPFRVNAGAIHSYVFLSTGKTRYLSELASPDPVTIVGPNGGTREVRIGRVKIERRPMIYLQAATDRGSGAVILQKAETIRLVRSDGTPVSVTDIKKGDTVLVHLEASKGRHFGGVVEEHILEK